MNPSELRGLVIDASATIRTAMGRIDENNREVVLVVDHDGTALGLITDGDIRRGLLRGCTLDSPATAVMTHNFHSVRPSDARAFVLDLMKARVVKHMPVLDEKRRLVAVHFLRDLIGGAPKPNAAVIMAGGKGTRLRPYTQSIPKPMLEIAGRPMLERLILHLVSHGVHEVYLAVNFKAEAIEAHFGDGSAFGCKIQYLRETTPLGTAGPLALLSPRPTTPIFVMNGDLVTNVDLTAMLDMHSRKHFTATIGVGPYQVQIPFGSILHRDGMLLAIEEKPRINLVINRGIYILNPSVLDLVPHNQEFPITTLLSMLTERAIKVGVFYFDDHWLDVGAPEDLKRARGLA